MHREGLTPPFSAKYPRLFLTRLNKTAFFFRATDSNNHSGFKLENSVESPFINIVINIKFSFQHFPAKHKWLALVFSLLNVAK